MSLLPLFWLALFLVAGTAVFGMWIWTGIMTARRYGGTRTFICPETLRPVTVQVDTWQAIRSRLAWSLRLRLKCCDRWPDRRACAQDCLAQLARHQEDFAAIRRPHPRIVL